MTENFSQWSTAVETILGGGCKLRYINEEIMEPPEDDPTYAK